MIYLKEGLTPLNLAFEDNILQEANSTYQLTFKYPVDDILSANLIEETLLIADDLHSEQEFIIFEVENHNGYVTVFANQVATLLNTYAINELSVKQADGNRVMRSLVSSIKRPHNFTFYSDIAAKHDLNLNDVTVAAALFKDGHSIMGQWRGDLIRDKYAIKLLANGGTENEALFMYKKNLTKYQQKKSIKDLRTRIHFKKVINSQNGGEKDKVLTLTLDSPLINKYQNIYEGTLEVQDQDVVDEVSLLKYAKDYYKNTLCDVIEDSIEIDVIGSDLPVNIFDTVTIFHEKYNLDIKKKITKYTFSPMRRKLKTIGFGALQQSFGNALSSMVKEAVEEKVESKLDPFKIQKNLAEILKKDKEGIQNKFKDLEEKAKAGLEVKKALLEADGTVSEITRTKILDAVAAEIGRLKTIITEAELIEAIQARLNFAKIKTAIIDKAFIDEIISNETFRQEFEEGTVDTQNIFTKLKDTIQTSIKKEFITKEETKRLINDLTISADGIRQITQEESEKVFEDKKDELKGAKRFVHKAYSPEKVNGNYTVKFSYSSDCRYVGYLISNKKSTPFDPNVYTWLDLPSGVTRLHLAFANSADGKLDCSYDSRGKTYVGYYFDNNSEDIQNPELNTQRFTWIKLAGDEVEYTHFKYRVDLSSPILDNPTPEVRYMGVAKSTSKTAPNDPSAYKWVTTAGQKPYFYTAYANSADGTKGFNTSNSVGKAYIGTLFSFQNTPSENPADYKWVKIKGDDADANKIFNLIDASEFYDLTCFKLYGTADVKVLNREFKTKNALEVKSTQTAVGAKDVSLLTSITQVKAGELYSLKFWFYIDPDISTDAVARLSIFGNSFDLLEGTPKGTWIEKEFAGITSKMNGRNVQGMDVPKFSVNGKCRFLICMPTLCNGETPLAQWNNSLSDLKDRYLNLDFKIDGSYSGGVASNVKYLLNVIYGGKRVGLGVDVSLKAKGAGINQEAFTDVTYNGTNIITPLIPSGLVDGTPLDVTVQVKYRGLIAMASARLTNLPDPKLIEEITTKYKTFESTLEKFESKIGEESKKTFKLTYRIPNQCSQSGVEKKGNDLYFAANPNLKANKEYFILADLDDVPANQVTRIYSALNGGDNKAISNGLNVWRVKYASDQPNINIYPLGSNTKVKNVEIYEVPEVESTGENIYKNHKIAKVGNDNFITITPTERLLTARIYRVEFKVQTGYSSGQVWKMQYTLDANKEAVKKLENGINTWIFRSFSNQEEIYFQIPNGVTISEVKLFSLDFSIGQKLELNISNVYSEIEQTKNQIKSAVTENNFGTVLTQNAHHLRLAWNNISKFIQFESGGMSFYESGVVNQNKLTARVTDRGYQFWRDGYELGSMGTNSYKHNNNIKGIQFDLEYDGWFMGWAYRESKTNDAYTWKWVYASGAFADYKKDSLNAWCDIDLHGYSLRNGYINPTEFRVEGGVTTDSYDFMLADGRSLTIRFKNGFVLG